MSLQELEDARLLMLRDIPFLRKHVGRRFQAHARGDRIDLRRSIRLMHRHGGGFIPLARKRRIPRSPDLVILADISGSMSVYTRMFLHLAWLLTRREPVVHSFVFGTRLSNISVKLQGTDVDSAMSAVAASVQDWDGGTRIASSIAEFNRDWSRRVLARDSTVLLLSDGLERETDSDLEFQMRRLHRSCSRLIWMNPMLRYSEFEPKALGIRKMLPHVDAFVSAHNVSSLAEVLDCLNAPQQHAGSSTRKYQWAQNS
jgi:hypothetical protein